MLFEPYGYKINIRGIVQGVGFRPFIYNLADHYQLRGWVRNTSGGVEIEIHGESESLHGFIESIKKPPPLARIDEIVIDRCQTNTFTSFSILESSPKPGDFIPISPDVSICEDCLRELFDPEDRRYRYPFINCTNCGPRFTIIEDIPYDRPFTTMSGFKFCPSCQKEYENPLDRRFHAQPVACPDCGPHVWFESGGHHYAEKDTAIKMAREWIKEGKIIALKGLGGYHLVCDASNHKTVDLLRERKKRSDKPFALMSYDPTIINEFCIIEPREMELLLSRQRPIVLLNKRQKMKIAEAVAPFQNCLGFMLPYTPLHYLITEPEQGYPDVLVMTSGNLSEEPIAFQDDEAIKRLSPLADGFLIHNRPIHIRVDDSVVRNVSERTSIIRRSRGYIPDAIKLSSDLPNVLAVGGELKNTFCLTRGSYAFLSHHIGDMENVETLESFEQGIDHFENIFRISPEVIACDQHPDYLSTHYAEKRSMDTGLHLLKVQHHHAHLASCLADNDWNSSDPVIGITYDGIGFGSDGHIWGGEVLFGGYEGFERLFHLREVGMPGGDLATRNPSRMALSHLWYAKIEWEDFLPPVSIVNYQQRAVIKKQLEKQINSPLTSSMGRLFDAAAALIGIRQTVTYEGQAAIELENIAATDENGVYDFEISQNILDPTPLWFQMVSDIKMGISPSKLSARFHNSIVELTRLICDKVKADTCCRTVALSGGVWQNKYLLEHTVSVLSRSGYRVLTHQQVPTNDGGISLGQALVAAYSRTS